MKQNYSNYTAEDFEVWGILFERQFNKLSNIASEAYIDGIEKIRFNKERIPNFDETDKILQELTGWSLQVVPNIIPCKDFFELLYKKKFCATTWLRKMSQLDYLEEPDMFHDVFGHAPLLTNQHFCDFILGISAIALKHNFNPKIIELLGNIYWFTVEFGLIKENGEYRIYGAGILSSPGETEFSLSNKSEKIPFDINRILNTTYRTDVFQDKYFVIESYEQLYNSLPEISKLVDMFIVEANTLENLQV